MTESEWQTSTSPSDMHRVLVERGLDTEEQCRRFVEACRCTLLRHTGDTDTSSMISWQHMMAWWCSLQSSPGQYLDESGAKRCDLIRCLFGNPWRQYELWAVPLPAHIGYDMWGAYQAAGFTCRCSWGSRVHGDRCPEHGVTGVKVEDCRRFQSQLADWLTWRDATIPKLARACVEPGMKKCDSCKGTGSWLRKAGGLIVPESTGCVDCKGMGYVSIASHTLDPLKLAIMADALEEAGCTDDGILGHLRQTTAKWETSHDFSSGSVCCECGMTHGEHMARKFGDDRCVRTRPVVHYRGCHVVELFLAKETEKV